MNPSLVKTDIAIVGTGPAGMAAALALVRLGYQVALVASKTPQSTGMATVRSLEYWREASEFDSRVYALTPASQKFLTEIGIWSILLSQRCSALYDIEVFQANQPKSVRFESAIAQQDRLATIVEHGHLYAAAQLAVSYSPVMNIDGIVESLETTDQFSRLRLADGRLIEAPLVIAADGGKSALRGLAAISVTEKSYNQTAVVANLLCDLPHRNLARQWFTPEGVIALLPLAQPETVNLVWSAPNEQAKALIDLDPNQFCKALENISAGCLGRMAQVGKRQSAPLSLMQADRLIGSRILLLGDAAHVIHPMAGHGLNLGFGDAECLRDILGPCASGGRRADDPGVRPLLRRYERARREPIAVMGQVTDGLFKVFFEAPKPLQWARDFGWRIVGQSEWIKKRMVDHASKS